MIKIFNPVKLSISSISKITDDVISMVHFFEKQQYTYNEAEQFIEMLKGQIKFMRECREYNTYMDYNLGKKSVSLDNVVITTSQHQNGKS